MKIGLTTIYSVPNFGSVLQTYATQEILKTLGNEVQIINYKYPNEWHYSHGVRRSSLKSKVAQLLGIKLQHRKAKKLEWFRKSHLNFTKPYKSLTELENENWNNYDTVCVGSDQVWNPRYLLGDAAYMLSYIPDTVNKISIASSFAVQTIPENLVPKYQKYLSRFKALSVREDNGKEIINNELNIKQPVEVLLDPTLLLNKSEWIKIASYKKCPKQNYILIYMLTYAFEPRPFIFDVISYFKEKYHYEVVVLEGHKEAKSSGINMTNVENSTIEEFLGLFHNASLVITTSFHGTAFAANLGRPLVSVVPPNNGDDRQSSLLKRLGLEQCIAYMNKPIENIQPFYNQEQEQQKLDTIREQNKQWIKNMIL